MKSLTLFLLLQFSSPPTHTVWVWDSSCLTAVSISSDTRMEAPGRPDGTPDMSQSHVYALHVRYRPDCGRIEIRK